MLRRLLVSLAALIALVPVAVSAQVTITPLIGGYVEADNWNQVKTGTENYASSREGKRSFGLNLEVGSLRGSVAYASGTMIKDENRQDIAKGSVLGIASDVVIRPLMRMYVQPYLIAGFGAKFYSVDETLTSSSDVQTRRFAFHPGVGADVMIGPVGLAVEVTNFLNKGKGLNWNGHDAFAMAGMKIRLP